MIKTHVITGFLGVGKTSTLQHLISQKPAQEQWTVLVNEFGQQGLDAQLLTQQAVTVLQVAGGCACCAALLGFQKALHSVLRFSKVDRLFIEPSGLGHPDKILELLGSEQYQAHLSLQPTLTLVDARHLSQDKYRQHDVYQRQLLVADEFVANKQDLYGDEQLAQLQRLSKQYLRQVSLTQNGRIDLTQLDWPKKNHRQSTRWLSVGEEKSYASGTLYWSADHALHEMQLIKTLAQLNVTRLKGRLPCGAKHEQKGQNAILINGVGDEVSSSRVNVASAQLSEKKVYFLEWIHHQPLQADAIEKSLQACVLTV